MEQQKPALTTRKIFVFWIPLAATWLMMAFEGPFLAAIIARLAEPKYNLAAYGVAFSFALIIEAPIIMIMSASTALVKDRDSFVKLRRFTHSLNATITAIMLIVLIPPIFTFITMNLIELPERVARLTHLSTMILIPWPGVIGLRRFYQGILIRSHLTRRVAYGTLIRLMTMTLTALLLFFFFDLPGAAVGATALCLGVTVEAIASRLMARASVRRLPATPAESTTTDKLLTYWAIARFYYPLALTSMLGLGVYPLVTFFMGQSRYALESLAVFPVINSLVFIFRSLGLSYQEVAIALMGERFEGYYVVRKFAFFLGMATIGGLSVIGFTPIAEVWFRHISGLSAELTRFALLPTQILAVIPGLTVLLCFQRAILVNARTTNPITWATAIEVASIIVVLMIAIQYFDAIGVIAAALAFLLGRSGANTFLIRPILNVLKQISKDYSRHDEATTQEMR